MPKKGEYTANAETLNSVGKQLYIIDMKRFTLRYICP